MNLNKAFILGNVTRDPETRSLPSGQPVANFGVATNRFYKDQAGNRQKKPEFHNIVAFGKLAEICSKYLTKGSLVFIEGRIQTRGWQDQAGIQKTRTEIIAEGLQLGPRSTNPPVPYAKSDSPADENFRSESGEKMEKENIPIIEEDSEEEINVKDIPF